MTGMSPLSSWIAGRESDCCQGRLSDTLSLALSTSFDTAKISILLQHFYSTRFSSFQFQLHHHILDDKTDYKRSAARADNRLDQRLKIHGNSGLLLVTVLLHLLMTVQ